MKVQTIVPTRRIDILSHESLGFFIEIELNWKQHKNSNVSHAYNTNPKNDNYIGVSSINHQQCTLGYDPRNFIKERSR